MSQPDPTPTSDPTPPGRFSTLGLLVKLILLPGLVVFVLVVIAVIFGWLTLAPAGVDSLVEALNRDGNARWRAAVTLAGVLHDPENRALKEDPVLAARLAETLRQQIDSGGMQPDEITLRMYLCRALGEFRIADPLPVLLTAAGTERDEREVDVRRSAIEAVAVLASNVGPAELRSNRSLTSVLLEASADGRAPIRSSAAFTLGVLGGEKAEQRLEALLGDGHPDVRYNAATGLARRGNPKCVDVLLEMLDPDAPAGIDVEKQGPARGFKRAMILTNALRAISQLAAANPAADTGRLAEAVDRLCGAAVEPAVRVKATQVLRELQRPTPAG